MKHEELLARLHDYGYGVPVLSALRAVVELHKPSNKHEVRSKCAGCYIPMPCPTIQAIEKELQ